MKLFKRATYRVLFSQKSDLVRQVESLRKANAQLQTQFEAAQQAKLVAENQAQDFRKDKERQKSKISELKKAIEDGKLVADQLRKKCEALEADIAKLKTGRRH